MNEEHVECASVKHCVCVQCAHVLGTRCVCRDRIFRPSLCFTSSLPYQLLYLFIWCLGIKKVKSRFCFQGIFNDLNLLRRNPPHRVNNPENMRKLPFTHLHLRFKDSELAVTVEKWSFTWPSWICMDFLQILSLPLKKIASKWVDYITLNCP